MRMRSVAPVYARGSAIPHRVCLAELRLMFTRRRRPYIIITVKIILLSCRFRRETETPGNIVNYEYYRSREYTIVL